MHDKLPASADTGPTVPISSAPLPGTATAAFRRDNALLGIGLVVLSTLFFSLSDVMAKHLTQTIPPVEIAWLRYIGFCVASLPAAWLASHGHPLKTRRPGQQAVRGLAMVVSALLFMTGLQYYQVADATAVTFVAPIFITALSVLFLGEKVGIRRWTATVVGLIGVLVVLRPGSSAFGPAAIFPVASAALWAVTVIVTRSMSDTERPETTLAWSAFVGLLFLTLFVPFQWVTPDLSEIGIGLLIGLVVTMGQWVMVRGYANADASVLAPFSYVQLLWATLLGLVVFGTIPGLWTFVGAAIIIASGIYTAHRERMRRRAAEGRPH